MIVEIRKSDIDQNVFLNRETGRYEALIKGYPRPVPRAVISECCKNFIISNHLKATSITTTMGLHNLLSGMWNCALDNMLHPLSAHKLSRLGAEAKPQEGRNEKTELADWLLSKIKDEALSSWSTNLEEDIEVNLPMKVRYNFLSADLFDVEVTAKVDIEGLSFSIEFDFTG